MRTLAKLSLLKLVAVTGLIVTTLGYQAPVHAAADIHFSKYRFVFDDSHRKDSLVLTNTGLNPATCVMSTENFIMSESGPTKLATKTDTIANSAANILRFSPRRVTIAPGNNQTVRIASRRRPNINDGEFVSYLKISCQEQPNPNEVQTQQITVKPNFIYYIPLQVRVGKLTASTRFDNIKLNAISGRYSLTFSQIREGNRSIVGKLEVFEKKSGDLIGNLNNMAIYMPFGKKEHKIGLKRQPKGPLQIVFTEDESARGTITAQTELQ